MSDQRIRRLERAASAGDQSAQDQLIVALWRAGRIKELVGHGDPYMDFVGRHLNFDVSMPGNYTPTIGPIQNRLLGLWEDRLDALMDSLDPNPHAYHWEPSTSEYGPGTWWVTFRDNRDRARWLDRMRALEESLRGAGFEAFWRDGSLYAGVLNIRDVSDLAVVIRDRYQPLLRTIKGIQANPPALNHSDWPWIPLEEWQRIMSLSPQKQRACLRKLYWWAVRTGYPMHGQQALFGWQPHDPPAPVCRNPDDERLRRREAAWKAAPSPETAQAYAAALRRRDKRVDRWLRDLDTAGYDLLPYTATMVRDVVNGAISTSQAQHAFVAGDLNQYSYHPAMSAWLGRAADDQHSWGRWSGGPLLMVNDFDITGPAMTYNNLRPWHVGVVNARVVGGSLVSFGVPAELALLWADANMPNVNNNPDERTRRLERAASQGDFDAQVGLLRQRMRQGEVRLDSMWLAAIFNEPVARAVVGWPEPLGDVQGAAPLFQFLGAMPRVVLPVGHGSFKRTAPPWPLLKVKRQHQLATAVAWAFASGVENLAQVYLGNLYSWAADAPAQSVPDDWEEWAREWEGQQQEVTRMLNMTRSCFLDGRKRSPGAMQRIRSWASNNVYDTYYMIEGLTYGGYNVTPPTEQTFGTLEYPLSEGRVEDWLFPEADSLVSNWAYAGYAAFMAAFSAVRACYSKISRGRLDRWSLNEIPVTGWRRDTDQGRVVVRDLSAVGFASMAYSYAAAAESALLSPVSYPGRDHAHPEGQSKAFASAGEALLPLLMTGAL